MKKVIILSILLSIGASMQAQNNVVESVFCVEANPNKKEVYLIDINETRCKKSPRDVNNKRINLKAIEDNFGRERIEFSKVIFDEYDYKKLKNSPVYATIYINSRTRRIDAVSFRFRNMNMDEIKSINIEKFAKYRELLKNQIIIQTLIFEKEIVEHGYTKQSFRVI